MQVDDKKLFLSFEVPDVLRNVISVNKKLLAISVPTVWKVNLISVSNLPWITSVFSIPIEDSLSTKLIICRHRFILIYPENVMGRLASHFVLWVCCLMCSTCSQPVSDRILTESIIYTTWGWSAWGDTWFGETQMECKWKAMSIIWEGPNKLTIVITKWKLLVSSMDVRAEYPPSYQENKQSADIVRCLDGNFSLHTKIMMLF